MLAQQFRRNGGQAAARLARRGHQVRRYAATTKTTTQAAPGNTASSGGRGSLPSALTLALVGLTFGVAGAGAMWYGMRQTGMGFFSDEESLRRFVPGDDEARLVEDTISKLPLVAQLRADAKYKESRPHMKMPAAYRSRSLTGSALLGPGKMVIPPYAWIEDGGKSIVCISYVGDDLCGHPGIVHGGFLATMLDEGLARCCFGALPHNIAVTANLNVDYRKPTPAGSFLVLRAVTTDVQGRKAWVKGHVELLAKPGEEPTILAEATGLFISPKYAAMMPKIS